MGATFQELILSKYIFADFFMEWLTVTHLALLDSALCNRNIRKYFLASITMPGVRHDGQVMQTLRNYKEQTRRKINLLRWISVRKLMFRELVVDFDLKGNNGLRELQQAIFYSTEVLYLENFIISSSEELLRYLLVLPADKPSSTIKKIVFIHKNKQMKDKLLCEIISSHIHINEIDFRNYGCQSVSEEVVEHIREFCPQVLTRRKLYWAIADEEVMLCDD
jgi:hypothetical protein